MNRHDLDRRTRTAGARETMDDKDVLLFRQLKIAAEFIRRIPDVVPPALIWTAADGRPASVALARTIGLGRDEGNEVVYADPGISGRHFRIESSGNGHLLTDLNSRNGTRVNGERLSAPRWLRSGDVIQAGALLLVYVGASSAPAGKA